MGVTAAHAVALHLHVRPHRVGHVVAEADVIHRTGRENGLIARLHLRCGALAGPLLLRVGGVVAAAVHVAEVEPLVHGFQCHHHVVRVAGVGIVGHEGAHAADLEIRVDLVAFRHHHGRSHQLVVHHLIQGLLLVLEQGEAHAGVGPAEDIVGGVGLIVDLVEGHPVLDLVFVALHHRGGVVHEEVDRLPVHPAAVLFGEGVGHLKVAQGDHRLDAVLEQLVEQVIVELQACFVGFALVAPGEDAAPGNGGAEALEAQLRKQLHVLFVGVVEVDALVVGVMFAGQHAVGDAAGHTVGTAGHHVADGRAAAIGVPAAFQLMGSHCAAPQKVFRKHVVSPFGSGISCFWVPFRRSPRSAPE